MRFLHPTEKAHFCMRSHERVEAANQPSEMAYRGHASEAKPKRSLEPAAAKAMSLERVGCGNPPQVGTCPLDTHDAPFFASGAVFFSAEPTFCSFPYHNAHHPTPKVQHSLLVLPSVHTIINFATKFFEMFTKLQSEHPHKVFQVFRVFRANNPRLTKRAQRATNTTTPRCSSWSVCRISRR